VDVVVNATGLEDPVLVALITGHGVAFRRHHRHHRHLAALERLPGWLALWGAQRCSCSSPVLVNQTAEPITSA
jgi:hypothetical protein